MRLLPRSVRLRLTLWYAGALALIVLVFSLGVYFWLREGLLDQVRQRLDREMAALQGLVLEDPDELEELEEHGGMLLFCAEEDGKVFYESSGWQRMGLARLLAAGDGELASKTPAGRHLRVRIATFADRHHTYRAAVACDTQAAYDALEQLRATLLIGVPAVLILAVLGGYVLAGRLLAPVGAMAEKARQISADRLDQRLPMGPADDEFARLASVFNDTLGRLEEAFERLRRFTADASHELRTPLTALRSVGEVALRERQSPEACREAIASMLEEVDRLTRLVDSLLMLARADAGKVRLRRELLDLAALAGEVVEHLRPLADEKQQRLTVELPSAVSVLADRTTLRQALINLLDNAIKYTPTRGEIRVRVFAHDGEAVAVVSDSGPGIPPEERQRVFERFYRLDKARSREMGGAGLGLAIAQWAVAVNAGRIELDSKPGRGSTFRIVISAGQS